MSKWRFLILRRITQLSLIGLYFMGAHTGWTVLTGNLSSSLIFGVIPMSDPYAVLQMLFAGAAVATTALIGAAVAVGVYALILGRAFCAWVCPMNLVTDFASQIRRWVDPKDVERKVWLSRNIRYWVLGLSLIVSALMGVAAFELISPIAMLHRGIVFGLGFGWAAVLAVLLFDLFVHKNGFCGHLCPLGGFWSQVGRFSPVRVRHDADKCTRCMNCVNICPERQVLHMVGKRTETVSGAECTNCGRCIEVCNDDAMGFGLSRYLGKNEGGES